jgi:hypothetical protein
VRTLTKEEPGQKSLGQTAVEGRYTKSGATRRLLINLQPKIPRRGDKVEKNFLRFKSSKKKFNKRNFEKKRKFEIKVERGREKKNSKKEVSHQL